MNARRVLTCGRPVTRLLLAMAFAAMAALASWVLWGDWPNPAAEPLPDTVDAIIVLGGGADERPREACRLWKEGRAPLVVVTGDGGTIMAAMRGFGVPEEALVHENLATSTMENAQCVQPLLAERQVRSAILVTTWSHQPRARRIFERQMPEVRFYSSFESRSPVLNRRETWYQRRERLAALHHLVVHRLWCF